MNTKYLFPSRYKKIGWLVLIPTFLLGLFTTTVYEWEPDFLNVNVIALFIDQILGEFQLIAIIENNILNELLGIFIILSSLLVAFSKEPDEDELISHIRLESLVWATYVNYGVLLLAVILVYDVSFYWVMMFNMFTILIFFIIRFNWAIWKLRKFSAHEE